MALKKVKVLLVASHPVQYSAPLMRMYAREDALDVTVAYCTLDGATKAMDADFGVEFQWDVPLLDGYRWMHLPNLSPRPRFHTLLGLVNPGLWSLVRREQFDVVVCIGYRAASFWIAGVAARISGAALVLTTDAPTLDSVDGRRWKVKAKRLLLPLLFKQADAAFAPSTRTYELLASLGMSASRVFVIPNVVDNQFFEQHSSETDVGRVRKEWGIPERACVALYCGKLAPWKRPEDLLEASLQVPDLHLVYAGDGPRRGALEERAHEVGTAHRVHFLGFKNQTQLPKVYAAADFLVLPSLYEPFGLVVNEAFACGRPAVVSDACGCAGDLVEDGRTGLIFSAGNRSVLGECLTRLTTDGALLETMGENARSRVSMWGPRQNVDAFREACLTLAKGHGQYAASRPG